MKEKGFGPARAVVRLAFSLIILFLPVCTVCAPWTATGLPDQALAMNTVQVFSDESEGAAPAYQGPGVGAVMKHKWNTTYSSRLTVSGLASETDTTSGNYTLYDNGTFNCYEDEHGTDRNYTGRYVYIGTTASKIQCSLDSNGLREYKNMLRRWARNMAHEKGAVISNISLSFTSVRTSRVAISKTTGIPGKAKVGLKGTISADLDGAHTTKKFIFTSQITFERATQQYTLSVQKSGTGSGTVTATGINCGSDCSEAYTSGTSVILTAAASSGSSFAGWSGCDSTSGTTCTVSLTQNRTVTATFTPNYTLTVQKYGIGSGAIMSSPAGINCGGVCSGNYANGTQVTLTATPGSGLTFTNWSGCDSMNGNTCTVTMTRNRIVTATFIVCTPRDSCHVFAGYNPQTGCIFRDQRTVLTISPTLQRFSMESPDGRVNLYYDTECAPWEGDWFQGNEPADNFCGPTAGMNLLDWYGAPSTYDHLGDEMNTNDWISTTEALKACLCSCSPCPKCLCPELSCSALCTALSNTFFDVGTPPDDLENTLRKHSLLESSVGYLLFRHRGNPGLETLEYLLAQGSPIVVLLWNGKTLHWTLIIDP